MKSIRFLLVHSFSLLVLASLTLADQLILHNGTVIEGTYVGGDARSVRFIGPDGNVQTYSVGDVSGIGFGTPPPTAAPPVYAAPPVPGAVQRQVAHSPTGVTVPAGTLITVRLIDSIDADLTGVGERFRASIDDPIVVGSQVVVPRYADATVQVMRVEQSGALKGSDEVALKIYDITLNGRSYHLATDYAELQGKGKGRKTIRNTAIGGVGGAVIGGIFGGKKGAAIGAGAGAGTGIAVAAARGTKLKIPSETRLEFVLRAPLGLSYSVGDVSGTGFGTPPPTATPPVYTAPPVPGLVQRQVAHSPTGVTVPAGTLVTVRLIDSIDADLTGVGERFRASIDDPIVVGSQVVVPRYADATVQVMRVEQSGALKGSDEVALKIYDITVNGRSYHLATDYAELQGKGKGRKTIRNTAIGGVGGAVIGGIFGGKKGAAIGAGAGAGTGIAVAAARGTKLQIPSETRLEFVLRAPLGL